MNDQSFGVAHCRGEPLKLGRGSASLSQQHNTFHLQPVTPQHFIPYQDDLMQSGKIKVSAMMIPWSLNSNILEPRDGVARLCLLLQ